jgi:hypothetical protein
MDEQLYSISVGDFTDCPFSHYFVRISRVIPSHYYRGEGISKIDMLDVMGISAVYGYVTDLNGVLDFSEDCLGISGETVIDFVNRKGLFEYKLALCKVYYEE